MKSSTVGMASKTEADLLDWSLAYKRKSGAHKVPPNSVQILNELNSRSLI